MSKLTLDLSKTVRGIFSQRRVINNSIFSYLFGMVKVEYGTFRVLVCEIYFKSDDYRTFPCYRKSRCTDMFKSCLVMAKTLCNKD